MKISVNGQSAAIEGKKLLVSGSVNFYIAEFTFDSSWDDFTKTAVFRTDKISPVEVLLTDDRCIIPWEVLRNQTNQLRIGVYGTKADTIMPTVYADTVVVEGAERGEPSSPPTPSISQQILERIIALEKNGGGAIKPAKKTADMTQEVGIDDEGRLFTAPSSGTSHEVATDEDVIETLVEVDMLKAVADGDGAILSDGEDILIW